jgi:pilus assembly protein CpaB
MRNLPPWVWLVMAGFFGLVATFMAVGWLKGQSQQAPPMTPVVVAGKDIGVAMPLAPDHLAVRSWPPGHLPKGSFARVEDVKDRVAVFPFEAGEPILESKLAPQGMVPGLTALVSARKRAMTVKVDEASGVAGFLAPEHRVDVVVTINRGEYSKEPVSKVVLQNLKVLGTGQKIEKRPGEKPQVVPTVTLEVSPEEGERLALASQEGYLSLVLRSQNDQALVETTGVRASQLLVNMAGNPVTKEVPPSPPPPPRRRVVEVVKGTERESVNF